MVPDLVKNERNPVIDFELAKNRGQVMRHSGLADIKPLGNLLIFQALADQLNHFLLARSDRCNLALLRTLSFVSSIQKFIEYALRHCVLKPKSSAGYLANRKRNIVSRLFTLKNS